MFFGRNPFSLKKVEKRKDFLIKAGNFGTNAFSLNKWAFKMKKLKNAGFFVTRLISLNNCQNLVNFSIKPVIFRHSTVFLVIWSNRTSNFKESGVFVARMQTAFSAHT